MRYGDIVSGIFHDDTHIKSTLCVIIREGQYPILNDCIIWMNYKHITRLKDITSNLKTTRNNYVWSIFSYDWIFQELCRTYNWKLINTETHYSDVTSHSQIGTYRNISIYNYSVCTIFIHIKICTNA